MRRTEAQPEREKRTKAAKGKTLGPLRRGSGSWDAICRVESSGCSELQVAVVAPGCWWIGA